MDDNEIRMRLKAIGMKCFVLYYHIFSDDALDVFEKRNALDLAVRARGEEYTQKAIKTRVNKASGMIRAGAAQRALHKIRQSKSELVTDDIKNKAKSLLDMLDSKHNEHNGEQQAMSNDIVRDGHNLLLQFRQVIFHGPPGTGKTYNAKKVLIELFGNEFKGELPAHGERWNIVQFHPSYNYEDFVRGIKVETHNNQIVYKTVNRVFGEMCKIAATDTERPYALIIDEINRANVSAVLGELIYALEYRGEPIKTPYAIDGSAELTIPKNLYIIGTMNTADRTIGQIDYAVRRRFAFLHCPPDRSVISKGALDLFDKINGAPDKQEDSIFGNHLSPDFHADDVRIGHSYFLGDDDKLAYKIRYQVVPILEEYLKDGVLLPSAAGIIKQIRKLYAPEGEEREMDNNDEAPPWE